MQDRTLPKKTTNIKSFIGVSISLHLAVIGLVAVGYFFSNNTVSANQYNLEHTVQIDLAQISLPSSAASNDQPIEDSHDDIDPTEPEVDTATEQEPLKEQPTPLEKETVVIEQKVTSSQKSKEVKTETKATTEKKQPVQKVKPKNNTQSEIVNKDQNNTINSKSNGQTTSTSVLIKSVNPQYPKKALDLRIEGYVIVAFDINADGKTENIRIVEAKPNNVFNNTVIAAIKQWRYKPVKQQNIQLKFKFNYQQKQIQFETAQQ